MRFLAPLALALACSPRPDGAAPPRPSAPAPASSGSVTAAPKPAPDPFANATEIPVGGGALLGCHAERAGEWVRVVCEGKVNVFGHDPTRAAVDAALEKADDARAETAQGRVAVAFRWAQGVHVEATVGFADETVVLEAYWPNGAAEPQPLAQFRGVADTDAALVAKFTCRCRGLATGGEGSCDAAALGDEPARLECLRGHLASLDDAACAEWLECEVHSPSAYAECAPGEVHTGACPTCDCSIACTDRACPPGLTCDEDPIRGTQAKVCSPLE